MALGGATPDNGQGPDAANVRAPAALGYLRWLDGLRGVAVLAVLAYHLNLLAGGFLGVDVFFVLSGFLITTLLVEEWQAHGAISLKRFYLRRALRLLPAFLALLLVCGLTSLLMRSPDDAQRVRKEILLAACYVTNWPTLHMTTLPLLGHTWSLSVEEQFYLIWPVVLYGLLRSGLGRRKVLLLVGAGAVAAAVQRAVLYPRCPADDPQFIFNIFRLYMGLDTRADALLIGCLVGLLAAWDMLPKKPRALGRFDAAALISAAGLGYLAWRASNFDRELYFGFFTVVALMVGAILVRLLAAPCRPGLPLLESAPLVGVGRISYGLYLFHWPIIACFRPERMGWSHHGNTLLAVGLIFAAATASYCCLERPCLRLKHWLRTPRPVAPFHSDGRRDHPSGPLSSAA